ncbi:MAG: isoprenylcysteine carboxylmethyltransferase family protein [Oceanicaulis sp.]|jgi:protein-S-isoprenylcysteine O-methyltransferase Ste14
MRPSDFYDRIFGSGPMIAAASGSALALAWIVEQASPDLRWPIPAWLRLGAIAAGCILAAAIIIWSVLTLRPERRGAELVTDGPFRYVRHPLYAACLAIFGPALVVALAHPAYAGALVLAHVAAHQLIRREERLMTSWFPQSYDAYAAQTGRFLPRPRIGSASASPPPEA